MKAIILNASAGVGKTTLLKQLERNLPEGFAIIDGDDVGRIVPLKLTLEWLDLIQDNIISCANSFQQYGTKVLVISFVFPSEKRLERLNSKLAQLGIQTKMICMYCKDEILEERIITRNTSRIVHVERAIECNSEIKDLKADYHIDTSFMTEEEVMREFIRALDDINRGS